MSNKQQNQQESTRQQRRQAKRALGKLAEAAKRKNERLQKQAEIRRKNWGTLEISVRTRDEQDRMILKHRDAYTLQHEGLMKSLGSVRKSLGLSDYKSAEEWADARASANRRYESPEVWPSGSIPEAASVYFVGEFFAYTRVNDLDITMADRQVIINAAILKHWGVDISLSLQNKDDDGLDDLD